MSRPLQWSVYKGMGGKFGAFQFQASPPRPENPSQPDDNKMRAGAVFVEAAPTIGKNTYDWDNKILFALGVNDIGKILAHYTMTRQAASDTKPLQIYHDPDAGTAKANSRPKKLTFGRLTNLGSFSLSLSQKRGEDVSNIYIPLGADEAYTLFNLLTHAQAIVLGWN